MGQMLTDRSGRDREHAGERRGRGGLGQRDQQPGAGASDEAGEAIRGRRRSGLPEGGDSDLLDFDDEDARTAGQVRAALEGIGAPIGAYDLLIAGQALRRGLTVVTANTSEFARVAGLSWEDWTN
jgi:predicted nucleic acid-binding protein